MSTAPKSFSHKNICGSESDNAIELEDDVADEELNTISKDELITKRIQQFALDMKSEDDEESKDKDESDGIVVEDDINDLKLIDSNANAIAENNTNKIKEATTKKYEEIDTRNKTMSNTIALLECNSMRDLSDFSHYSYFCN